MNQEITEQELGIWLRQYLNETFGEGTSDFFLVPPNEVKYGERVVYKYKSGKSAKRIKTTQADIDAFQAITNDIAANAGGVASTVRPAVDSGLPYPRFVDIPEKSIFWPKDAEAYNISEELLPTPDFDLEWMFGLMFSSSKELYYLDFTHPKVKGIFSFEYEREFDLPKYDIAVKRFMEFIVLMKTYTQLSRKFNDFNWVKIVQKDSSISIITN